MLNGNRHPHPKNRSDDEDTTHFEWQDLCQTKSTRGSHLPGLIRMRAKKMATLSDDHQSNSFYITHLHLHSQGWYIDLSGIV